MISIKQNVSTGRFAVVYKKSDYIGRQAREQNGNREADRRIVQI